MVGVETEGGEVGRQAAEQRIDIDMPARVGADPNQAVFFGHRQLGEPVRRALRRREGALIWPRRQRAVEPVAPAVIRADKVFSAVAAAVGDARAAVAADVEKRAELAVLAAGQQDRYAGIVVRHPVASLWQQCRQTDAKRTLAEE